MSPVKTSIPPEFLRAVGIRQREDRRKVGRNIAILALLFLFLIGSAAHRLCDGRRVLSLNQTGVHAQATLLSMDTGDIDYTRIQIEYSWLAPRSGAPGAPMKKFTGIYQLAPALAKDLHEGQTIEVVYPQDRPDRAIPVLAARRAFGGIGWFAFFAAIVFLLLILSLVSWLARAFLSPFSR